MVDFEEKTTPQNAVSLVSNTPSNQALYRSVFLQSMSEHPPSVRRNSISHIQSKFESISRVPQAYLIRPLPQRINLNLEPAESEHVFQVKPSPDIPKNQLTNKLARGI